MDAGHIVRAMNINVEPQKSHDAGMAIQSGLMFVSCLAYSAYLVPGDIGIDKPCCSLRST